MIPKNILTKHLIFYLLFSAILINASIKLKERSNTYSQKRIATPTRPTPPTRPESNCNGSKTSTTTNGKKVILSKSPEDKLGDSSDNGSVTTSGTSDIDNTVSKGDKSVSTVASDPEIPKINVKWFDTKLKAKDIGVNSQGELYVVGADSKLYLYEFLTNSFIHIEGDFELSKIFRVDVSWEGIPYVITETGDTYYLSCDHKWMRLPGCSSDVGTGRGGEVFKTGCEERENGYGVYKLFCQTPVTCDYRGCLNFRKKSNFAWTHTDSGRTCEWFRIDGNGVKIDVSPYGYPYVIDKTGEINLYDGMIWRKVSTKTKAYDLTLSNEGVLYYIGQDANIYKSVNENEGKWIQLEGQGIAITAGPFGHPWVIQREDLNVIGSAKSEYN